MHPFISFEGIDGSGKTTLRDLMLRELLDAGQTATSVGQNSWLVPKAATTILLARERGKKYQPDELIASYVQDKTQHYRSNVAFLRKFGTVISDRFYVSDIVYMNVLHGIDMHEMLERFLNIDTIMWPEQIFFINVDAKKTEERIAKRGKPRRHYEQEADLTKLNHSYQMFFETFGPEIPSTVTFLSNEDGSQADLAREVIRLAGLGTRKDNQNPN
ncbi:dTMP kinase [Xanthobacter wiegelii]|uniref:dTMP kinase n=1 Tax=Xanthobacter wiegelii TaxID=3119913 RepID=UPI003729B384